ncbi:hypothetical protein FPZ24_02480 [Sphingomonas panacisoli]|uniref:DUF5615 domain-containing protein n=1 Tax=Sphingomonas panacisoli TaxID=1813879 RepID=A0A5B8LH33_9SPHN|nr:DUF5615 family PIN-like protein [Sphingomonas panacisoli]QDZ06480.1 hypothetical protein FPZ24_02480 [Sphingomonas panacisoli]
MKFLVDAQLPPALCSWLRDQGHVAMHVADIGMLAASDSEIALRAETDNAILISKDEDFLTLRLPDRFGFLWMRCGNATNRALLAWLDPRWEQIERLLATERLVEVR